MRTSVGIALSFVVTLSSCAHGQLSPEVDTPVCSTQAGAMRIGGRFVPPPATFEVQLPDRGVSWNSGGEWVLSVDSTESVRLTVVVIVEPEVELESLRFVIRAVDFARELWSHPVAARLYEGTHQFTFGVDTSGLPPGVHGFAAMFDIARDDRDPCGLGDTSGGRGEAGLGWIDVGGP